MVLATAIVQAAKLYGLAGLLCAAAFLAVGIGRIDRGAQGSWLFRPQLIPGVVLLWPLVLWRWRVLAGK